VICPLCYAESCGSCGKRRFGVFQGTVDACLASHGTGSFHRPHRYPCIVRRRPGGWIATELSRTVPDRILTIETMPNRDVQSRTRAPARLRRHLKRPFVKQLGAVAADDALLLVAEDLLEIDTAKRHKHVRRVSCVRSIRPFACGVLKAQCARSVYTAIGSRCVVITSRTTVIIAAVVSPGHSCPDNTRFVASSSTAINTDRSVGRSPNQACGLPSICSSSPKHGRGYLDMSQWTTRMGGRSACG